MKPEIKARWLTALRSGEYKQAQKALRRVRNAPEGEQTDTIIGHCCLGVLCEITAPETGGRWSDENKEFFETDGGSERSFLPNPVRYLSELDSVDPIISIPIGHPLTKRPDLREIFTLEEGETAYRVWLSVLNDKGVTFEEIANLIEEFL